MANTALFDDTGGTPGAGYSSNAQLVIASGHQKIYVGGQFYMTTAQMAAGSGYTLGSVLYMLTEGFHDDGIDVGSDGSLLGFNDYSMPAGSFTPDEWHTIEMLWDTAAGTVQMALDGVAGTDTTGPFSEDIIEVDVGAVAGTAETGQGVYVGTVWVGTGASTHNILSENWSSGDFSNWTTTVGGSSIVSSQPSDPPAFTPSLGISIPSASTPGRVFIAFDDGPIEPAPTWTRIDGDLFPDSFVSGYDIETGRQTLLSQTDTGTATVYCNDQAGLFDDRNLSSPYQGKLSGRQILLRLYNPVTDTWETQFRGLIDSYTYDIDGSSVDADGAPINASIQITCVDIFDYLVGYGLTPGLDGVTPPFGADAVIYYAATAGTVDDRIIEVLTDVGLDPTQYVVASGNVHLAAAKYDPDESALQVIRDAAEADLPFIANVYVDRQGRLVFRGRYSRFYPDDVAAEAGSDWDFQRWTVGDGTAIIADATRAQIRDLSYARDRANLINAAMCYPQGLAAADMPDQVFVDTSSVTAYGRHDAQPMTDLLLEPDTVQPVTGDTGKVECLNYATLLVKNQAFPREEITSLQVKSTRPDDDRAAATWGFITQSDVSHIVNVAVGYPGGTGFTGDSPQDDYYIEGRQLRVRSLDAAYDYAEYQVEVSPAVWSMDTHGVFANPFNDSSSGAATLTAGFTAAF